jgi:hypothetical protein
LTRLHRTVLILLLLTLPVQGAMAASRWLCFAASQDRAASAGHEHPSAAHARHHETAGDVDTDSTASPGPNDPTSHDASGTCNLCAACSLTVAAPPPPLVLGSFPPSNAGFPPVFVPVPHNVADGPERPPRTI